MMVLDEKEFKSKVFDFEANTDWKYSGDLPAIVDFYADWCGPCKALSPILEQLSTEFAGKIHIYKVDTDASPDIAAAFGVRSIPSLLFVPKDGKPTMTAGLMPKGELKSAIRDILKVNA